MHAMRLLRFVHMWKKLITKSNTWKDAFWLINLLKSHDAFHIVMNNIILPSNRCGCCIKPYLIEQELYLKALEDHDTSFQDWWRWPIVVNFYNIWSLIESCLICTCTTFFFFKVSMFKFCALWFTFQPMCNLN